MQAKSFVMMCSSCKLGSSWFIWTLKQVTKFSVDKEGACVEICRNFIAIIQQVWSRTVQDNSIDNRLW